MNSDLTDEYDFRMKEAVKNIHEIENHYMGEIQKLNADLEQERKKSNQLEKECSGWEEHCDGLTKRCAKLVRDRDAVVEYWTKHCEGLFHEHRKSLAAKDREISGITKERDYYRDRVRELVNNGDNFCGNCAKCKKRDDDTYVCTHYFKMFVDPDQSSCLHFKSNRVDKPDQPCCKACDHDDCDNCTLCPF